MAAASTALTGDGCVAHAASPSFTAASLTLAAGPTSFLSDGCGITKSGMRSQIARCCASSSCPSFARSAAGPGVSAAAICDLLVPYRSPYDILVSHGAFPFKRHVRLSGRKQRPLLCSKQRFLRQKLSLLDTKDAFLISLVCIQRPRSAGRPTVMCRLLGIAENPPRRARTRRPRRDRPRGGRRADGAGLSHRRSALAVGRLHARGIRA